MPENIRETPRRDDQRSKRQHITVESPLKIFQIRVQILAHGDQRHINRGDIGIQDRKHHSDHEQSQARTHKVKIKRFDSTIYDLTSQPFNDLTSYFLLFLIPWPPKP